MHELVFGQKPHATIFPGGDETTITNEEDLELDGTVFEGNEVRHNLYLLVRCFNSYIVLSWKVNMT